MIFIILVPFAAAQEEAVILAEISIAGVGSRLSAFCGCYLDRDVSPLCLADLFNNPDVDGAVSVFEVDLQSIAEVADVVVIFDRAAVDGVTSHPVSNR